MPGLDFRSPRYVEYTLALAAGFALGGLTVHFPNADAEWIALFGGIFGAMITIIGANIASDRSERKRLADWNDFARAGIEDVETALKRCVDPGQSPEVDKMDLHLAAAELTRSHIDALKSSLGRCPIPDARIRRVEYLLSTMTVTREEFEHRVKVIRLFEGGKIDRPDFLDLYDFSDMVTMELKACATARSVLN